MNSVGIYWIAIELTTLVSTFLVAFEREAESMEAAWKYIMVVSAGISLALLGTVLFYWGGTFVLGPTYNMTWSTLAAAAPQINPVLLTLAFLLVLVGYGTKVGLAPMHAWLPDAHSEGPAPVSVMLSGALLNTAMVGIFRFLGIVEVRRREPCPSARARPARRFLVVGWRAVHRSTAWGQAPDGLFEHRAHGSGRARLRLRRSSRGRGRVLPHAQPLR